MSGIASAGVYIARHRMPTKWLGGGRGERSVAWHDEDSVTMAVEAAQRAMAGMNPERFGLLVFASTTHAFSEKQSAALIATALNLPSAIRTMDLANSLRSGVDALAIASDWVTAQDTDLDALVIASDVREGAPGSTFEREGGDGAAAFVVSKTRFKAKLIGRASESQEVVDVWRRTPDRFSHGWEERFTSQYGYLEPACAVARQLRNQLVTHAASDWLWSVGAPTARACGAFRRELQLDENAIEEGLYGKTGFLGCAHALVGLASQLSKAVPTSRVAVVAHGDGADGLVFAIEDSFAPDTMKHALEDRLEVPSLAVYQKARGLDLAEYETQDFQGVSATEHYRDRDENLRLQGQRCQCGTAQFPKGRVCVRCGTKDQFFAEDFASASAKLVAFTLDAFFPAPEPPTAVGVVEVDGGPRIYMQIADVSPKDVHIGMPLRFVFRRIHTVGRRPNYFWKAVSLETQHGA